MEREHNSSARPRIITKTSLGILICRIGKIGRPEAALVHKRYTYSYAEFVYGRYSRHSVRSVEALFDQMTVDELLDIWSLNFSQMWYRMWLAAEKKELFNKKQAKFQTAWLKDDGGATLRRMVSQARPSGALLWEPPKGKPLTPSESGVLTAVREVREEARIAKRDYRLIPGLRRQVSYVHMGVRYITLFYVALANPWLARQEILGRAGGGALGSIEQLSEVSEVRWMDIEMMRIIEGPEKRLSKLLGPIFGLVKKFVQGKWGDRMHNPLAEADIGKLLAKYAQPTRDAEEGWHVVKSRSRKIAGKSAPNRRPRKWNRKDKSPEPITEWNTKEGRIIMHAH
jgi:8-oxo-dGTP pyrophosphatase MutT (NUDIX family)